MNDAQQPLRIFHSVGAVVAGALTGILLSLAADAVLRKAGVFPPFGQTPSDFSLALATGYRTVFGIAGAYLTARLAPYRLMAHVMVLGGMGFLASLLGAVTTWNKGAAFSPHWYPVALVVLALPTAWVGGQLRKMQLGSSAQD